MAFIKIWFWHWFPRRYWRVVGRVGSADEIPKHLPRKGVVIAGVEKPKWIAFGCPCGGGHRVMVNLDTARAPSWSVQSDKPLTITPSFDIHEDGKNCHFFIRDGKILWA